MTNFVVLYLISLGLTDIFKIVMIRECSVWAERSPELSVSGVDPFSDRADFSRVLL